MTEITTYRLTDYGDMITDKPRMAAYAHALKQVVKPGSKILDIGTGTGIFSLLACQLGAGHVDAVELDDAINVAESNAAASGYQDRITFHQALSTLITLPERADIIISDLRGILPLLQHHIPSIVDARRRHLKAGGIMIPETDTIFAALVNAPAIYRSYEDPWLFNDYGLDMSAGQKLVVNSLRRAYFKENELLVTPQPWATLDYTTIIDPDVKGTLTWRIEHGGTVHGLAVWFDTRLGKEIGFSNAPGLPELIYGQAFFPLQKPVTLVKGDTVEVLLQADLVEDEYVWRWNTQVKSPGKAETVKIIFRQSTFYSAPLSPARLRKKASAYIPSLKEKGRIDKLVLNQMDETTTLGEIAHQVLDLFPEHFKDWQHALAHVSKLSQKYS